MHETARLAYTTQIKRQLKCATLAWRDLLNAIAAQENDEVWHAVQAFLTACANLSKIFDLGTTRKEAKPTEKQRRGECLRNWLGPSEVLTDRAARNYFDHFDDRIDSWARVPHTYYGDGAVVYPGLPFGMITSFTLGGGTESATESINHFRTFFAGGDMTLYCGSAQDHVQVKLRPIWQACEELDAKLRDLGMSSA